MKIIITSGGTREKMDPVRYIGNFSTGKMGKALGEAFSRLGDVKIISGPAEVHYTVPVEKIESARDMLAACEAEISNNGPCDIFVACAAVADKRPKHPSDGKIKKDKLDTIELIENPDVLATISHSAKRPKIMIGFAAESENHIENARKKLTKKSCDLIVLNDTSAMGGDENEVTLVTANDEVKLGKASKDNIAIEIVKYVEQTWLK